ncbi:UNVERIFIED_CONTAM: hypothetical protein Sradi_5783300 [Sesamum radiatum]|uniref:PGG domain-containing protein n=1 Tax=Sesamum radiatum TaxID=300843 RepID=A0AAW2KQX3_SESRA
MASSSSQVLPSISGNTSVGENDLNCYLPLHKAAIRGDWESASKFFDSNPDAVSARITKNLETVLHIAVGRSEASSFVEKLVEMMPTDALSLKNVALDLVRRYPRLATTISPGNNTALSILAGKPSAFLSGRSLRSWQKLIYSCIPVKLARTSHLRCGRDIENPSERTIKQIDVCWQVLRQTFRRTYPVFVPQVKHIHDMKLMHCQAMELVKCLCLESLNVDTVKSASVFKPAVILSATNGLYEVIEEILSSFPSAIWCLDPEHHDLFQIAVINRRETIFNLLYDLEEHAHLVTQNTDSHNNNILHLAGKLAPPHRLSLVSGAALQMQRELQWYKEVENFVTPSYKGKENTDGKTPAMVFAEEHKDLIVEAEEWLKDTAKSCTFAATLIATVVFAAAITVPGGSSTESGLPIFQKQRPFVVFAVSNAVSLFSSVTSVLMFLFILTSRCAEADFLYTLPNTLIIGLVNLFLSLASMMVAFSSAMYAVFGHNRAWILAPLTLLACLPVTLFLFLQYPLLKDMIRTTYGPGIFGKKRKSIFSKSGNRSV